jgi:hypothetical protein
MNLFGSSPPRANVADIERIRAWVHTAYRLNTDVTISIVELQCSEPGCPPVETAITMLSPNERARTFKIHKTLAALKEEDVTGAAGRS